ncbi:KAP family P-loop domain protein [compost metagenome]
MNITMQEPNLIDGFNEEDIFNRKKLFQQIVRLIQHSPDNSLVFALDDKWGNGKTTFVKMLHSEISKSEDYEIDALYFDSFENDYQNDPFISISSLLYSYISSKKSIKKNVGDKILTGMRKVGASLFLNGSKLAITSISAGLVSGTKLDEIGGVISDSLKEEVEGFIENRIKSSNEEKANIESFKDSLKQINKDSNRKTLVIIDELDRARPDYALDLLERIKHLFSVDGLIFLLVMNREQFEKSISCRYGDIDARLYLNKFIHYWFTLPKKNAHSMHVAVGESPTTIYDYITYIIEKNKINTISRNGTFVKTLSFLIEKNKGSLRETERCLSVLAVIDNPDELAKTTSNYYNASLALIVFLKVFNPNLLDELISKRIERKNFIQEIKIFPLTIKNNIISKANYDILDSLIKYHYLTDEELRNERGQVNSWAHEIDSYASGSRARFFEVIAQSLEYMHIN